MILTVLDLLAVPWRLLQGLDDEGGGGGHDRDGGDTVLDAQLDSDLQTLPVSGRLGDIISDLLGRLQVEDKTSISRLCVCAWTTNSSRCALTRPNGPILGAREEVAPTSPPTHLMYTAREGKGEAV